MEQHPDLLLSYNTLYIAIEPHDFQDAPSQKYLSASISGPIVTFDVYTYEEIMERSKGNAIPVDDFKDVRDAYEKTGKYGPRASQHTVINKDKGTKTITYRDIQGRKHVTETHWPQKEDPTTV